MNTQLRLLVAAAMVASAASLVGAQAPNAGGARDTRAIRVPNDPPDAIGKPGSLTALETAVLNSMTDRNIVAHLMLEDSTEANLGEPISEIVHDTAVAGFARMLATEHAHALELDRAVVPSLRALPRLSVGDTTGPRALLTMESRFRAIGPDSAIDRTFLSAEIVHHEHLLNELGALRATAVHAPVQQRIDDEMQMVRSHLARAQALAGQTGAPAR